MIEKSKNELAIVLVGNLANRPKKKQSPTGSSD